jgi:hypothetical protein
MPSIIEVAQSAGLQPHKKGAAGEHVVRCPRAAAHRNGDARPSCRLNSEKNTFYCDPCGWGGGVVEFARELGMMVPNDGVPPSNRKNTGPVPRSKQKPLIFHAGGPITLETQTTLATTLGKVYLPETWSAFGVLEGRVCPEGKPEVAEPCIALPQPNGGFHLFRYERRNREERWRFPKGSKPDLLLIGAERPDPVILTEGEWDAMTAYEAAYAVATGTGGAGTWRDSGRTPSVAGSQLSPTTRTSRAGTAQ